MNIINNTSIELFVEYWVISSDGHVGSYLSSLIKPGEKLYENKSTTKVWNIMLKNYEKIFEVYNKPTSYKNMYFTVYYNNNKFRGEYINANIHNNYISGYNTEEQMANTFIIHEN